jgi:Tol biopolymer transport system component
MKHKILFVSLFCLVLIFVLGTSTPSTAQDLDPTATPTWVKPLSSDTELPPYLDPALVAEAGIQTPNKAPDSPALDAPDWFRMVFQSYRDGNWEIYSSHGNGFNQTNISNRSYCSDARPMVNGDITRVVFNADPSGSADIYVMNYDGSGLTNLTNTSNRQDYAGAWSPDSSRIAYVSNSHGDHRSDPVEVYVMNADGSAKTRLTYSGVGNDGPRWSPDGSRITWRQIQANGPVLMVMNPDGSNQHAITPPLNYLGSHAWSPDGTRIAIDFDADGDGWNELTVMNADGSGLHIIYDPGCTLCDAWVGDWSDNGDWLVFSRVNYVVYHNRLFLLSTYIGGMRLSDSNHKTFTTSGYDMNPSWQSLDILPPDTHINALPEYLPAAGLDITWDGYDQGPAGIWYYQFQYRLGVGGVWEDFPDYIHGMTSIPFSSETYETAYFRSQAIDNAENLEPWPENGDAWTKLYSWLFGGKVADNRGVLLPNAAVSISPTPWETGVTTDRSGQYQAHLKGEGAHTLNTSLAGYGAALPVNFYVNGDKSLDRYLPPVENLLENGTFEASASQLTGWMEGGILATTVVTGYSGLNAAGLGYDCGIPCLTSREMLTPTAGIYAYPKMAIGPDGSLYVIYVYGSTIEFIENTGGSWSEHITVGEMFTGSPDRVYYNDIAVDAQGGVHIVWIGAVGVQYRERHPDGTWAQPVIIAPNGTQPGVAVDNSGGVHVIYSCTDFYCDDTPSGLYYVKREQSGAWVTPVLLAASYYSNSVDLLVGPDNTVHILYGGTYMSLKPDGMLTKQGLISIPDYGEYFVHLQLDAGGTLHAFVAGGGGTDYAYKIPGGDWSEPEEWTDEIYYADMDIDRQGRLHALSITGDSQNRYILIDRNEARIFTPLDTEHGDGGAIGVGPDDSLHLISTGYDHLDYQTTPHALTDTVSSISQAVTIPPDMNQPTLSYMYKLWSDANCNASKYVVTVSNALTTTQVWSESTCGGWSHAWIDLSPWTSQTVTVTFALHQAAGEPYTHLYLDDISLGAWLTPIAEAIAPGSLAAGISSTVTITGDNFIATPAVQLNDIIIADVEWVDAHTLLLHLPAGLPPGIYTVRVTNPGGQAGICPRLLKVGKLTYMPIAIRPAAP